MVPEAFHAPRARTLLGLAFALFFCAQAGAQAGGAFGLSPQGLAALLAGQDVAPVLALGQVELADTGGYGSSAYYYLARWLDSREGKSWLALSPPEEARSRLLYRMAWDRASPVGPDENELARRDAGLALIGHLAAMGLWEELLEFCGRFEAEEGPEWDSERPCLDALDALGRDAELSALVARLGSTYPNDAAREADALSYFGAVADLRSGGKAWAGKLRLLLLERPGSDWTERAFSLTGSEERVRAVFSADELHAIAMRDAVLRKDYGQALQEALLGAAASMGPTASRAMVADAGKAFLYADAPAGHERLFVAEGWTARFYQARIARALERWTDAALQFQSSAAEAPTRADADSATWYALECSYRGALAAASSADSSARTAAEATARKAALDGLIAASASWSAPDAFLDLAGGLYRDALTARDWPLIQAMEAGFGDKLGSDMAARLSYTVARVEELGLESPAGEDLQGGVVDPKDRAEETERRFATIAGDPSAPLHYRALSAWRAGLDPSLMEPGLDTAETSLGLLPGFPSSVGTVESLVAGLAEFGLGDIAYAEVRARRSKLGDQALRRLAALFAFLGMPDEAVRLEAMLFYRTGFAPGRTDYEHLYPRPFLGELRPLCSGGGVPESLALGLLRSESLFKTDAVSHSGAVGLSQLMPATAAEQAKTLGFERYDLYSAKDNLAIGISYFSSLLDRSAARPLRAMMAYNAGWGRLKSWAAASGDLPDDLLVEALSLGETRQYCRNILQSTVMYGLLYYGTSLGTTVEYLVDGGNSGAASR
jgi:hypothetical protein